MSPDAQEPLRTRLVSVELLRPGPAHNQLLSPLTQYLSVCGNSNAGVVNVPYEHSRFVRRLKDLRYEGDPEDRQGLLQELGEDMGRFLGSVQGLTDALRAHGSQPSTLVHLRVTVSASELAFLPFELAKVPTGPNASSDEWLAIQTHPPICITRNIRTVSPEAVTWPTKPRILFIVGNPDHVPYEDHRTALLQAIAPFRPPPELRADNTTPDQAAMDAGVINDRRQQFGELLTILVRPTLGQMFDECRQIPYTHVHILTHGAELPDQPGTYGLIFDGPNDNDDVVSGERLANALTAVTESGVHLPTVVTIASCDSGNIGDVVVPGASVAHAVHQAKIPLVVAAQFPLSKEGSTRLTTTLYTGLLWGVDPLPLLQRVRTQLHALFTTTWHDWACLVVYEALPLALPEQLETLRYWQSRRAMNAGLERIDRLVLAHGIPAPPPVAPAAAAGTVIAGAVLAGAVAADPTFAVESALGKMPFNGGYSAECLGLRASARKRLAQAAFVVASQAERDPNAPALSVGDSYDLLDRSLRDYEEAAHRLLINDSRAVQRIATLHWVLVQYLSLCAVLGRDIDPGMWEAARLAADVYVKHSSVEEQAWARGSLAELWLLRMAIPDLSADERDRCRRLAISYTRELASFYPGLDAFPITSTRKQFARYHEWWGTDSFASTIPPPGMNVEAWTRQNGINDTARDLCRLLERKRATPRVSATVSAPKPSEPPLPPAPPTTLAAPAAPPVAAPLLATPHASTGVVAARANGAFFNINLLPAGHGDSLWIEYGEGATTSRWLIDCGTSQTSRVLLERVEALPDRERRLELFVLSHIDSDHIGGALKFLKAASPRAKQRLTMGDVWFNGWRHISGDLGARQAEMFSTAIQDLKLPWNQWRGNGTILVEGGGDLPECVLPGGMRLTLLSPTRAQLDKLAPAWKRELKRYGFAPGTRVDYGALLRGSPAPSSSTDVDSLAGTTFDADDGAPNGTSIAVLAEFGGASALLAADAHAPVLVASIRRLLKQRGATRLKIDAFKVSHHASQRNISTELIELLDCRRYLVSTNGDHFSHPDRQAIARIIKSGGPRAELCFNYRSRFTEVWQAPELQERYAFQATFPTTEGAGCSVSLL